MDRVEVRVNGLKEVEAALKNATAKTRRKLRKVVKDGAQVMLDESRRRVPVKTGNVKENLYIKSEKTTPNYVRMKVTLRRQGQEGFPLEVGHVMSGWYAGFPGTVAPRPFLRSTFAAKEGSVTRQMEDGIVKAATT